MTEPEQIVAAAIEAVHHASHLSEDDKREIFDRIEDMAQAAWRASMARDEAELDAKWAAIDMGRARA